MPEITFVLKNKTGLHARPAAKLVETANRYACLIRIVTAAGREANGKSILGVLGLGAECEATITVRAEGEDAEQALASILDLANGRFQDE